MNDRAMKECSQVLVFANKQVRNFSSRTNLRVAEINEENRFFIFFFLGREKRSSARRFARVPWTWHDAERELAGAAFLRNYWRRLRPRPWLAQPLVHRLEPRKSKSKDKKHESRRFKTNAKEEHASPSYCLLSSVFIFRYALLLQILYIYLR